MPSTKEKHTIVLGPADIRGITSALDLLLPWLNDSKFHVLPNGNLEFTDDEPVQAIDFLRGAVEDALPKDVYEHLGERSGLGWNVFFGHVVAWWLPQKNRVGLLRAFVDRAALHNVDLRLHWNQGRSIAVTQVAPDHGALITGGVISTIAAILLSKVFSVNELFCLIVAASGVVGGRIYQRVAVHRFCGDYLCQAPLGSDESCPSCGGETTR
jgi:hypothetical protein